jgi:hypothetical protein
MKNVLVLLIFGVITSELLVLCDDQIENQKIQEEILKIQKSSSGPDPFADDPKTPENKQEEKLNEKPIESIKAPENKNEELKLSEEQAKKDDTKASENIKEEAKVNEESMDDKIKTLPRKLLARRREEHLQLLKGIATNAKYEWRYQLVEIGVAKVKFGD